jgi:hypothetical protein
MSRGGWVFAKLMHIIGISKELSEIFFLLPPFQNDSPQFFLPTTTTVLGQVQPTVSNLHQSNQF